MMVISLMCDDAMKKENNEKLKKLL